MIIDLSYKNPVRKNGDVVRNGRSPKREETPTIRSWVDLSQDIYDGMPVYPGDPEVHVQKVLKVEKDGWNMNNISLPSHIATHVNVPVHAFSDGKTLEDFLPDAFCGTAKVFQNIEDVKTDTGLIFESADIPREAVEKIIELKPKFIGIGGYFESEQELKNERELLKNGIISYEGLVNIELLPKNTEFMFYGFPLKIKNGDGSPIRAVAVFG